MKPIILQRIRYVNTGVHRVWQIIEPEPLMVDHLGRLLRMPIGLLVDFWSTPPFYYSRRPPVIGDITDDFAGWHDFLIRCFALMGESRGYVQRVFWGSMAAHPDIGRFRATMKTTVTWPHALTCDGMGVHRQNQYNGDVIDQRNGQPVSLPTWVRDHYPDGPQPYDPTGGSALL